MVLRLALWIFLIFEVKCNTCDRRNPCGNGNGQKFSFNFCSDESGDALGFIVLDDTSEGTIFSMDFCMAVPDTPTFVVHEYEVSVQIFNEIGKLGVNYGHPGLVFNLVDSANYDFVYFRPHWPHACYGYGYVREGNIVYDKRKSSRCPSGAPRGRTWHDMRVRVIGHQTHIYLNKQFVATINHHFPNIARSGPAILKGFKNRAFFRRFAVNLDC